MKFTRAIICLAPFLALHWVIHFYLKAKDFKKSGKAERRFCRAKWWWLAILILDIGLALLEYDADMLNCEMIESWESKEAADGPQ